MALKTNYTSESVLNIKFSPNGKGYDPLQVDKTLDLVIKDYEIFVKTIEELNNANERQIKEIEKLREIISKNQFELATLRQQVKSMPKTSGVTEDNYKLLKRVSAYERVLHRKGIDLKKALSDPDNC